MKGKLLSRNLKNNMGIFSKELFGAETLEGISIVGLDFANCKFAVDLNLSNTKFERLAFSNCQFSKSSWTKLNIKNCNFASCTFDSSTWKDIDFDNCCFYNCEFHHASFDAVSFKKCLVKGMDFDATCTLTLSLSNTNWFKVIWPETQLNLISASDCHFYHVDFTDKQFPWQNVAPKVILDQCKLGALSFKDLTVTNVTLSDCEFDLLDLTHATLNNVNFQGSTIKQVQAEGFKAENLQMARTHIESGNFKDMNISVTSLFWEANLKDCDFSNSKLGIAVFEKAKLEAINFANAEFAGCNLADTELTKVSFKDAKVNNLNTSKAVLHEVEGLDSKES